MPARLLLPFLLVTPTLAADPPDVLPNTKPLELTRPLWEEMIDGLDRFCLAEIEKSVARRERHWKRDYSSHAAYRGSVSRNQAALGNLLGTNGPRYWDDTLGRVDHVVAGQLAAETSNPGRSILVRPIRWPVFEGVNVEGLLLIPPGKPIARVVAIPDADVLPESLAGLDDALPPAARSARWLAERGCLVVVPTLISRDHVFSGSSHGPDTNQPHREWIYRPAFEMGRTVGGFEVRKVSAVVDAFRLLGIRTGDLPVGVTGLGEGGRIALYAAALDERIDAAHVCGYFDRREDVWREPIDRNVWELLDQFGDAEIASLIAPRPLVVDECWESTWDGPKIVEGRRNGAAPGVIRTPKPEDVTRELARLKPIYNRLGAADDLVHTPRRTGGEEDTIEAGLSMFLRRLGVDETRQEIPVEIVGEVFDEQSDLTRQLRQVRELAEHVQRLMEVSDKTRFTNWMKDDRGVVRKTTVQNWEYLAASHRRYVYDVLIGRLPEPTMPLNPRSRLVIDEPTYTGYEVVLDVYPDVIAGGILLLPKDLKEGERRPVVVCQHGLEGKPMDTISTDETSRAWQAYKGFATQLVERGFVVYAPQNPYKGGDRFRTLQRKSNPLGRSLFSYITRQHERTLEWLAAQPFVDGDRIGFYGLSYGGKTAMRVPALLPPRTTEDGTKKPGYCLSICSADFNEWIRKCTSNTDRYSYVFTGEYEMFEWNMGHVANYAELAMLISPRPFMVERGHDDGVAPDEWVAWEYAKVRRHYVKLGIGDRTEIEWFDGPHTINGRGTFAFLHRHLDWPVPK